jgi:hypothetical protein
MKTIFSFLFTAIFTLIAFSCHADNKFGIRAGYQLASFHVDGSMLENTDNLNSFYLGIFKEKEIVPHFDFGYGLDFMQNGAELSDFGKYTVNYLSVPLYLKAKIGPVFGLAGLAANFKLSDKLSNGGMETDASDNYATNDFDLPLFVGAGIKILMITIEGRYNWGMIEMNDITRIKNQYFQVGASYSF